MRKIYRMFLAIALCTLGTMNVSAGERVPLENEDHTFFNYDGFGSDATPTGECEGQNFLIDVVDGCPIGDTNCNAWLDMSSYTKMYVKMAGADADGNLNGSNPRIFINRMITEGQFNADREAANCLVIPNAGTWAEEYYTIDEDDYYVIDLRKILADFGFVHFHSIKGSAWNTKAIVYSIEVEKGAPLGCAAQFSNDVVELFFDFDTNIPELVKESNAKRVFFDKSCVTVKVNGENKAVSTVEGLEDGRFYVFMEEGIDNDAVVEVSFTNNIGLVYISGPNKGNPVDNYTGIATLNSDIEEDGGYPYAYVAPTVMNTDPDEGSFNLPNNVSITVTFDKKVDCAALKANANGTPLTVSPNSGAAQVVTLSGNLPDGEYVVTIEDIFPELNQGWNYAEPFKLTINVGKISTDPSVQPYDLIAPEYFANCPAGGIPEGFLVMFGGAERPGGSSHSSGPRMFDFAAGGDFTKGLYFREGYAEYGSTPGYDLGLEAGKKYVISFNSAMWKDNGTTLDLKIFNEEDTDNPVFTQTVNNKPNMNGSTGAVNGSTKTEINFIPDTDGYYIVRWDRPGFNEVLIGNVSMKFMPNIAGYEYIMTLNNALEEAKKTLENNSNERYLGEAYNYLSDIVAKYESWESYSPKAYTEAVAIIEAATKAMKDHRTNCDGYDEQIKKAIDVVRQNAANKFAKTDLYNELSGIVAKYHGSSQWQNVSGDEENPEWQLFYEYDILTDDAQLIAATAELKDIANTTSLLFTEGVSSPENALGGKATGIAVLIDRLRQGAETLKSLPNVDENDDDVVEALNSLSDDDAMANILKERITARIYNELRAESTTLFEEKFDELTLETYTDPINMTVFVKNPNTYKLSNDATFTDEAVPGWITPDGYNRPALTPGWGAWLGTSLIAQDAMFQTYGGSYRVEQTIDDLPAGIYTVKFGFWEREDGTDLSDTYVYISTSDGLETQQETTVGGQAFPFASGDNTSVSIEDIEVTDGQLTIGVNAGEGTHTFFNDVLVLMTAPAPGFNYPKMDEIIRGDVNTDGSVDVADISSVISVMAGTASYPYADVNKDGVVDVADISKVISIMAAHARQAGPLFDEE